MITPLAPRTPNTAVEEASFKIVIFSTSLGSIWKKLRSTPSTRYRGLAFIVFNVLIPRIKTSGSSPPGCPDDCMEETPDVLEDFNTISKVPLPFIGIS